MSPECARLLASCSALLTQASLRNEEIEKEILFYRRQLGLQLDRGEALSQQLEEALDELQKKSEQARKWAAAAAHAEDALLKTRARIAAIVLSDVPDHATLALGRLIGSIDEFLAPHSSSEVPHG